MNIFVPQFFWKVLDKNTNDEVVNTFVLHNVKLFGSTDLSDSHTSMYPLGVVTV